MKMTKLHELDKVAYNIIKNIPADIDQAQYSTKDQLRVLIEVGRKLKLYDAVDLLKSTFHID